MARHELTLVPGQHTLLTVCTICSACVATESYVHVGFCDRGGMARGRALKQNGSGWTMGCGSLALRFQRGWP
jgi:hypothetical protein